MCKFVAKEWEAIRRWRFDVLQGEAPRPLFKSVNWNYPISLEFRGESD
jgi:hypothetical protein